MPIPFPPKNYILVPSQVEGIEIFAPAPGEEQLSGEIAGFKCPQCGAVTEYSVLESGLKCDHCGYASPTGEDAVGEKAEELEFTSENLINHQYGWGADRRAFECDTCGASTAVEPQALVHTCAFCGSHQVLLKDGQDKILRPRYLIPFEIENIMCEQITSKWLGSSWMTPRAMRRSAENPEFSGVFLPYWTFDSVATADWQAEVGHTEHERYFQDGEWKVRTIIKWKWERGKVRERFDDLIINGTNRISEHLLRKINAFDLHQLRAYEPGFLAGYQALAFDRALEEAWEQARSEMRERTRQACRSQASTTQIRSFSLNLDFSEESWRYIILPVYLTSYRYQGQSYQVLINGQTGVITGQRPVDWMKVWLIIAAILCPGVLFALIGLSTVLIGGAGVLLGGIGFVLMMVGLAGSTMILRQAMAMDDI